MRTTLVSLSLALCTAAAAAQEALSTPPDVLATHGRASALATPLRFCTFDDAAPLRAVEGGVRLAWTLAEPPPGISKIVALSGNDAPGCVAVQPLPAGGVDAIQLNTPYAVVDKAPDWSAGFTALVIARKNDDLSTAAYAARLRRHVKLVTSLLESRGMDGYVVEAGLTHEWAYLHWIDEDTAKRAFATAEGASGLKDSRSIQRPLPQAVLALH